DEAFDQRMCSFEDQRILDAQTHEVADGEESAIVDLLVYVLPVGQHVELLGKEPLQQRKARWVARFSLEFLHIFVHERLDTWIDGKKLSQAFADGLKLEPFFANCAGLGNVLVRKRGTAATMPEYSWYAGESSPKSCCNRLM